LVLHTRRLIGLKKQHPHPVSGQRFVVQVDVLPQGASGRFDNFRLSYAEDEVAMLPAKGDRRGGGSQGARRRCSS
jgi:hypothetical protein